MPYSESQKAVALAMLEATRGNVSEVSRKCRIPRQTIQYWAKGGAQTPDMPKLRQEKKEDLADLLEELARSLVAGITPDKIGEAPLNQIAVSAGIAIDKMQLLRNKPTAITNDTSLLPDSELDARIAALERGEIPQVTGATADSEV